MSKCGSQGKSSVSDSQRDVMGYRAPVIPGWSPFGSLKPGIGGSANVSGTQGRYSGSGNAKQTTPPIGDGAGPMAGQVGIKRSGGEGQGYGTNRKG